MNGLRNNSSAPDVTWHVGRELRNTLISVSHAIPVYFDLVLTILYRFSEVPRYVGRAVYINSSFTKKESIDRDRVFDCGC